MKETESITEQQAQEMADIIKEIANTTQEIMENTGESMRFIMRDSIGREIETFLSYIERFLSASFLTRWYFLRKMRKQNEKMHMFMEFYSEYEKEKENNNYEETEENQSKETDKE